jgi:hypothetical protein
MASLSHSCSEPVAQMTTFMGLAEAHRLLHRSEAVVPVPKQPAEIVEERSLAPSAGLDGARAAIAAISFELCTLVYVCAMWQLAQVLR